MYDRENPDTDTLAQPQSASGLVHSYGARAKALQPPSDWQTGVCCSLQRINATQPQLEVSIPMCHNIERNECAKF